MSLLTILIEDTAAMRPADHDTAVVRSLQLHDFGRKKPWVVGKQGIIHENSHLSQQRDPGLAIILAES